jgi:16S rRNA (guanine966-N2)-methyltransferase
MMRIIGGKYRGKKLSAPSYEGTRPTSDRTRETLFNILLHNPHFGPHVVVNKAVLDVFAGTGALGLEAFSRGAKSVTFIEHHQEALPALYANVSTFHLPSACVIAQEAQTLLQNPQPPYDLIFMDPPYHHNLLTPTLIHLEEKGWIAPQACLLLEMGKTEIVSLPSFVAPVIERLSGPAKLLFCMAGA